MGTREISRERWSAFFCALSKQIQPPDVTVMVEGEDIGDQVLMRHRPLLGFACEDRGGAPEVSIFTGDRAGSHPEAHAHPVRGLKQVWVREGAAGVEALDLEDDAGHKTIVLFERARTKALKAA